MGQIRLLTEKDYEDSLRLAQYAFQYELTAEQKEARKKMMDTHEIWGDFENGQLTAKLHIIPFNVFIGNREMEMGGIAGVATWPEYRRKRKVDALLKHSLKEMKNKGQSISLLHPFQFHFYRRYGWEWFASYKKITIENKDLIFLEKVGGRIERVHQENLYNILNPIYERFAIGYNGLLKRSPKWWESNVMTEGMHAVVYVNVNNERTGYVLYEMKNRHMDVQEIITLEEEAIRGMWNFICQHDSMVEKVTIVTTLDDPLPHLLHNPRVMQEIVPYFMARVVDVESFLENYPFPDYKGEPLFLHVHDEIAPWNNGIYQLGAGGLKACWKARENISCVHPPRRGLHVDINTMSAMFLGHERPLVFYKIGKISGTLEEVKKLESIIPRRSTAFIDFF